MAAHAHTIRARSGSTDRQSQQPRVVTLETDDTLFQPGDPVRQSLLNQFLSQLASAQMVDFVQECERRRKLKH